LVGGLTEEPSVEGFDVDPHHPPTQQFVRGAFRQVPPLAVALLGNYLVIVERFEAEPNKLCKQKPSRVLYTVRKLEKEMQCNSNTVQQ
jgi:hypothetical protein